MPKRRAKGQARVEKDFSKLERLAVQYVPVRDVSPNSYNPNRQSEHDFELLIRSMEADGFTQPIIVNRDSRVIVDGEHRWTAGIVTEALRRRGLLSSPENIAQIRSERVSVLDEIGDFEVPVVFVDMTEAQAMVSTLRHNRARGSEDFELTASLFRDLQQLGALDVAQDELLLDDVEMNLLLGDENAPDALAADEYGEAWEPSQTATEPGTSADGRQQTAMTPAAIEDLRKQQERVREATNEEERQAARRDSQTFRLALVFGGEEALIVKTVLGPQPAEKILSLCKELYSEEDRDGAPA
jgi:ParB-like chromosome segregation protein Spo0J